MILKPTLENLRYVSRWDTELSEEALEARKKKLIYVKQSKGHGGLVHTKLWEDSKLNKSHTLRVDKTTVELLLKKPGPHGRRGRTRGRPASGIRHLIRREIMLIFTLKKEKLSKILEQNIQHKSGKKEDITLVIPDLSSATKELKDELISLHNGFENHPTFKKNWAPFVCRLIELIWLPKTQ